MNDLVSVGIVIFAVGLFTWIFGLSRLRGCQNSLMPVSPSKIRVSQLITWIGAILFVGGIALAIYSFCC